MTLLSVAPHYRGRSRLVYVRPCSHCRRRPPAPLPSARSSHFPLSLLASLFPHGFPRSPRGRPLRQAPSRRHYEARALPASAGSPLCRMTPGTCRGDRDARRTKSLRHRILSSSTSAGFIFFWVGSCCTCSTRVHSGRFCRAERVCNGRRGGMLFTLTFLTVGAAKAGSGGWLLRTCRLQMVTLTLVGLSQFFTI